MAHGMRTTVGTIQTFNPILVWFYRMRWLKKPRACPLLSIPFWSDFISLTSLSSFLLLSLSIPFWSDFITRPLLLGEYYATNFQSHFGLILSRDLYYTPNPPLLTFNPILVWFYLSRHQCATLERGYRFQSHFGLILSVGRQEKHSLHQPFQSHFGLILSCFNSTLVFCFCKLSIPFWSDFIRLKGNESGQTAFNFQSHFGLILSNMIKLRLVHIKPAFNPILVWFYLDVLVCSCSSAC